MNRNRVFYNRVFMHVQASDQTPTRTFCFIIEYPSYHMYENDEKVARTLKVLTYGDGNNLTRTQV